MAGGITGSCGCNTYVGTTPTTQSVLVNSSNYTLVAPTASQFFSANSIFDYNSQSANSTQTINLKLGASKFYDSETLSLGDGSGAYTITVTLDYINANRGAIFEIQFAFPPSTNPIVVIKDRYSNSTLITLNSPGVEFTTLIKFVWTGSIWQFRSQL